MDKDIIYRVFTNLIGNAIKASPKNSKITIRTMHKETSVIGEVRDRGKGIPKEMQKHIFDKFASAQNDKIRAKSSIGLGLTFCKLAVEAHEGEISVTSRENMVVRSDLNFQKNKYKYAMKTSMPPPYLTILSIQNVSTKL